MGGQDEGAKRREFQSEKLVRVKLGSNGRSDPQVIKSSSKSCVDLGNNSLWSKRRI